MKSARRHSLESNDLVGSAAAFAGRVRPYLGTIALATAVAVVVLAGWSLVASRRKAARAESSGALLKALDSLPVTGANGLEDVIRRYPNTPAAHWSQVTFAEFALRQGLLILAEDRERAQKLLSEAEGRFGQVLSTRPGGLVEERALFGSAKTLESLGRFDDARRRYGEIVTNHPTSGLRDAATMRMADLDRDATRQWYDWYGQQKPSVSAAVDGPAASFPQLDSAPPGAAAEPGPVVGPGTVPGTGADGGPGTSPEPGAGQPAGAGSGTDAPR